MLSLVTHLPVQKHTVHGKQQGIPSLDTCLGAQKCGMGWLTQMVCGSGGMQTLLEVPAAKMKERLVLQWWLEFADPDLLWKE